MTNFLKILQPYKPNFSLVAKSVTLSQDNSLLISLPYICIELKLTSISMSHGRVIATGNWVLKKK